MGLGMQREREQIAVEHLKAGAADAVVAAIIGVSRRTVSNIRRRNGIDVLKHGKYKPRLGEPFDCSKCGRTVVADQGHVSHAKRICRDCKRESRNTEANRAYLSSRRKSHPEVIRESMRRWREKNPHKWQAEQQLNKAIRLGTVVRPKQCDHCKSFTRIEGHHFDYSRPLDVMWLCRKCHMAQHRKTA